MLSWLPVLQLRIIVRIGILIGILFGARHIALTVTAFRDAHRVRGAEGKQGFRGQHDLLVARTLIDVL